MRDKCLIIKDIIKIKTKIRIRITTIRIRIKDMQMKNMTLAHLEDHGVVA